MHYRAFFSMLFLISISICLLSSFASEMMDASLLSLFANPKVNSAFVGLFSLSIAILAYIGLLIALYYKYVVEKRRLDKLQEERRNINEIHAELSALRESTT